MSCIRKSVISCIFFLLAPALAAADNDDVILGFGGETDSAAGRAVALFGDFGVFEKTWLSGLVAATRTGGGSGGLKTLYVDAGVDHWFDPLGIRIGGGYWGDADLLDSNDLRASVYFRNQSMSISADYVRRDFNLTFAGILLPTVRTIGFYGDGYGLTTRFATNDVVALSLGGMTYKYSRDINLQPNIDILRRFSTSRLSLMNSLLDYRVTASIDWTLGPRNVSFIVERWQTAIDQGLVDSIGVGLLTPVGNLSDVELRLSYDRAQYFGSTMTLSVYFYFFGI
jgi:hypothetical protein